MVHTFHRSSNVALPIAASGDGVYIIDTDGNRYLDASGGAAVSCLGHSNARVTQAIKDQADHIAFAHTGFFTNEPFEQLAEFLCARAPGDLNHFYAVSGGSEAMEAALKLARQFYLERGEDQRRHFIARRQSYHGNTLGALAVGGNMWRREPFDPILIDAQHVPPCYAYRDRAVDETEEVYGLRVANELEERILELGPETVIAFVAETVVGATSGALPPTKGYFKRIREICDRYDILLILDEVMCGMGRTGHLFACAQEDIAPDILAVAKGLGAGYQPIGAMLCTTRIFEQIKNGSGFFQHGHTYMGHPIACAASLAVQQEIEERDLLHNVREKGDALQAALTARFGNHPLVGDIRGRGLFRALELVADRGTKEPLDPALALPAKIKARAMREGLMCYPGGGTIDGKRGAHILLAPPFIIEDTHIEEIVEKLDRTFSSVFETVGLR